MFSDHYLDTTQDVYRAIHFANERLKGKPAERERIVELVGKSTEQRLSLEEIAEISLSSSQADFIEDSIRTRFRSGQGEVRYIAPTFQANTCIDICGECGWNKDRIDTERVFLKPGQFGQELDFLKKKGFGVIEISNGTSPRLLEWKTFQDYMHQVKDYIDPKRGEGFGICSAAFDDEVFAKIYPEFARFWVQWMETYDQASYFRMHQFTPRIPGNLQRFSKANFKSRLDSYDKVMELGGDVMLGVQYGVSQVPSFDALMTIEHARYLESEYGRQPLTFGTVINNSCGNDERRYADSLGYQFTREEYRTLLAAYKLAMPNMGRWLNTRVPFELIQGVAVDNDMYTGECSNMVPGSREGLVQFTNRQAGQFSVFEMQKLAWERGLKDVGLGVNYAWM